MGGEHSNPSINTEHNPSKSRKYESDPSNLNHPKLARAKYIKPQHQSQAPYLQMFISVPDEKMFKQWVQRIRSNHHTSGEESPSTTFTLRSASGHEEDGFIQTYYLPQTLTFEKKGFCGSSGVITATYEVFPFLLSEELLNRQRIKQPFSENELWYLLYILNCAGANMHEKYTAQKGLKKWNGVVGDIRPENIMISEDGEIQLISLHSFMDEDSNYNKTSMYGERTYLAPEQLAKLEKGEILEGETIAPENECFSIGLTVLSAVLLEDEVRLYDGNKREEKGEERGPAKSGGHAYSFDWNQFTRDLNSLRSAESYSLNLRKIVEAMLQPDPRKRLSCIEVVAILKKYETLIMNLEDFMLTSEDERSRQIHQKIVEVTQSDKNSQSGLDWGQPGTNRQRGSFAKVINNSEYNALSASQVKKQSIKYAAPHSLISSHRQENPQNLNYQHYPSASPPPIASQYSQPPLSYSANDSAYSVSNKMPPAYTNSVYQASVMPAYYAPPPLGSNPNSQRLQHASYQNNILVTESIYTPAPIRKESVPQNEPPKEPIKQSGFSLAEMGREAYSIRPTSDTKHHMFESYDQVLKNIDRQLSESRRMFPEEYR